MKKVLGILGIGLIVGGVFFVLEGIRIINVIVSIHHFRFIFVGCGLAGLGIAALINANRSLNIKPLRLDFSWIIHPEGVFLIVALVFGGVMSFLIPNQSGFDELDHLARSWEISGGFFIPNQKLSQGPYLPAVFREVSYRNQFFYDPVNPNYFSMHRTDRLDKDGGTNFQIKPVNFPTVYFPQAFLMGLLGRIMDAPILVIYYASRLLDLLGYLLLTFMAIRLIPFGKWLLAVLALAPIAVYQASTFSPDGYTNAACFLFIAWTLKLAFQENWINWKQFWITIGLTALLLMVKLNAAFLLPLLLLLVWRGFESRKMLPILAGAVGLFILLFVVGWSVLVYSHYYSNVPGYGLTAQAAYIFSHPFKFSATLFHELTSHGAGYFQEWVATYGFGAWKVPPVTFPLFGIALLAAWFFPPAPQRVNGRTRAVLILTGVVGSLLTVLVLYLTVNPIGSSTITAIQGRYFTPIVPVIFLGLVPGRKLISLLSGWVVPVIVGITTVVALSIYALGIYLSYYVICGTSIYSSGLCYQPQYKNWAPNDHFTQPVTQDVVLQQTFTAVCAPLRSVRVWSAPAAQGSMGETQISLKDPGTGAVLKEALVLNQTSATNGWLEITFPPLENAKGKQFLIEITSGLRDPASALSFGVSARREYLDGIIINQVPGDYDLLFQYGCNPLTLADLIHQRNP